jgi:hypothetical protein
MPKKADNSLFLQIYLFHLLSGTRISVCGATKILCLSKSFKESIGNAA